MNPADAGKHHKDNNNWMGNSLFAPLSTYMEMLRLFGSKSANGEGYLFNRFGRGWIDALQKEIGKGHTLHMSPTQRQAIFLWGVFLSSHFEKPKGFSVWLATFVRCLTASVLAIGFPLSDAKRHHLLNGILSNNIRILAPN